MKSSLTLQEMLESIKKESTEERRTIDVAEKTIELINKIKEKREMLNISQRDLAKQCGIKQPALARIESFKVIPQVNTLIRIADCLGLNIDALEKVENCEIITSSDFAYVKLSNKYEKYENKLNGELYYV